MVGAARKDSLVRSLLGQFVLLVHWLCASSALADSRNIGKPYLLEFGSVPEERIATRYGLREVPLRGDEPPQTKKAYEAQIEDRDIPVVLMSEGLVRLHLAGTKKSLPAWHCGDSDVVANRFLLEFQRRMPAEVTAAMARLIQNHHVEFSRLIETGWLAVVRIPTADLVSVLLEPDVASVSGSCTASIIGCEEDNKPTGEVAVVFDVSYGMDRSAPPIEKARRIATKYGLKLSPGPPTHGGFMATTAKGALSKLIRDDRVAAVRLACDPPNKLTRGCLSDPDSYLVTLADPGANARQPLLDELSLKFHVSFRPLMDSPFFVRGATIPSDQLKKFLKDPRVLSVDANCKTFPIGN